MYLKEDIYLDTTKINQRMLEKWTVDLFIQLMNSDPKIMNVSDLTSLKSKFVYRLKSLNIENTRELNVCLILSPHHFSYPFKSNKEFNE